MISVFFKNTTSEFWSDPNQNIELYKEEPVFDGPFSNVCYQNRNKEALDHFRSQQSINVLNDWDYLIFHLHMRFKQEEC